MQTFGCPPGIRTPIDRFRADCPTIERGGNARLGADASGKTENPLRCLLEFTDKPDWGQRDGARIANMQDSVATLFLELSIKKLNQATGTIATCVGRLTDSQVWERPAAHENSVGNLILHLGGNMRQWILHGVGGVQDIRVRDLEFNTTGGLTGGTLLAEFQSLVAEACAVIAVVPHDRMQERIHPQGRDVSVMEAIYQVVGHVQQHLGQIILLTKQMTGKDLDLTIPRSR